MNACRSSRRSASRRVISAVGLRLQLAQRAVLELPLELPDPEPVRERRENVQRLLRVALALLLVEACVPKRAHPLHAHREHDHHDAHVLRHGHEHLAQRLGRLFFEPVPADRGEPADAFEERGDLVSERGAERLHVEPVFDDQAGEQRRGDRGRVEAEPGQHAGRVEGVGAGHGVGSRPAVRFEQRRRLSHHRGVLFRVVLGQVREHAVEPLRGRCVRGAGSVAHGSEA